MGGEIDHIHETETASVVCMGDLVVDLISREPGTPLWAVSTFEKHPGGSPANVAIGLHALGTPAVLWSKVGADALGRYLCHSLRKRGLSTDGIVVDPIHPTKVALIGIDDSGDRTWEMLNPNSAYENIALNDVDRDLLKTARILHLGGAAIAGARTAETTLLLVREARRHGCLVSFDPNLIVGNAPERAAILRRFDALLPWVDLLKMSTDDWADLLGDTPCEDVIGRGVSLVIRTDGAAGSHLVTSKTTVAIESKPVAVVDATGAGDAFTASVLTDIVHAGPDTVLMNLPPDVLREWGLRATSLARVMLRRHGAVAGYEDVHRQ